MASILNKVDDKAPGVADVLMWQNIFLNPTVCSVQYGFDFLQVKNSYMLFGIVMASMVVKIDSLIRNRVMGKLMVGYILSFLIFSLSVQAQGKSVNSSSYKTALGVKVWDGGGISFKHFLRSNEALELIGYFWNRGSRMTGLYEIHGPISGATGLKWYIGPGAHIGFYNTKYGGGSFIGIDGVIGLDFKFNGAPINFSLDWQPSFEFGDNRGFVSSWGGLGIRYTY